MEESTITTCKRAQRLIAKGKGLMWNIKKGNTYFNLSTLKRSLEDLVIIVDDTNNMGHGDQSIEM